MEDPKRPKIPTRQSEKEVSKCVYVILEHATLEIVKVGKQFQLLSADEHNSILKKHNRDPAEARPDITHQCLLTLLDSPLNKAGLLRVYIHTVKNVLIEVNPKTRIPRTYNRFAGLMVQLLHKLSIKASNSDEKLMKIIKNPVTKYLPTNPHIILMSPSATKLTNINEFVLGKPENKPIVYVIGAFAYGTLKVDFHTEELSISNYELSASIVCGKLCNSYEELWDIL